MIGYYVHHHGLGHLTRARSVAAAADGPVVALTSLPAPADPGPFEDWVSLPRDDDPDEPGEDPEAGGALHWAPRRNTGYADRMGRLGDWVRTARPAGVVVDASVEVTVLARVLGLPVIVVAAPGTRDDPPHRLAHRLATGLLAPWTAAVMDLPHLRDHVAKSEYCGAISRFDGRAAEPTGPRSGAREVLVLLGAGGSALGGDEVDAARRATPGWRWRVLGIDGWADGEDVWTALLSCDVVVCHGGQNAVAEVAAARRPAVVVPQSRPFGEQAATAAALDAADIAVSAGPSPGAGDWPGLLARALAIGGDGWTRWSHGDGARRAAAFVGAVASGRSDGAGPTGSAPS